MLLIQVYTVNLFFNFSLMLEKNRLEGFQEEIGNFSGKDYVVNMECGIMWFCSTGLLFILYTHTSNTAAVST